MRNFKLLRTKNDNTRESLKKGLEKVAEIVGSTLGPYGRNVMLERNQGKAPYNTNDGATIARFITLEDPIENLGAQAAIDAVVKTNDVAGDGTTTTMVLMEAIVNEAYQMIDKEKVVGGNKKILNVIEIRKEIKKWCQKVLEELEKMAKPIKNKSDIEKVAIICVEDEEYGKRIAEMIHKIGINGHIGVEEGFKDETETEVIPGMKLDGGYVSPLLSTNNRREAIFEGTYILLTNAKLDNYRILLDYLAKLLRIDPKTRGKIERLTIITNCPNGYDKRVIEWMVSQRAETGTWVLGVKGSPLTEDQMEDIATYTGAIFIDVKKGMDFEDIISNGLKLEIAETDANGQTFIRKDPQPLSCVLGYARRVVSDKDNTFIVEGKGNKKQINERIKKLKEEREKEKTDMMKNKIDQRIASLAGSVGLIKVGSKTVIEGRYLKHKIEDAVAATKWAVKEGIVPGGGLALLDISKKLPKNILTEPLKSPYNKIQENAGGNLKIGKDIFDPVKITKTALENACSGAGMFIIAESAVVWERGGLAEEFEKLMEALKLNKMRVGPWRGKKDEEQNPDEIIQEEELD